MLRGPESATALEPAPDVIWLRRAYRRTLKGSTEPHRNIYLKSRLYPHIYVLRPYRAAAACRAMASSRIIRAINAQSSMLKVSGKRMSISPAKTESVRGIGALSA